MLPRLSRPSLAESPSPAVAWKAGPAKSLGLVRDDSESTATVSREEAGRSAALASDDSVDDSLETVMRGEHKRLGPEAFGGADSDDDLDETLTPAGLKKLVPPLKPASTETADAAVAASASPSGPPAPMPAPPVPVIAPDSARTRFAPIAAPPGRRDEAAPPPQPQPQAQPLVAPLPEVLMPSQQPNAGARTPAQHLQHGMQLLQAKLGALPPHRLALLGSSVLLFAAVLFLVFRRSGPPPEPVATQSLFPPPAFVAPEPAPPSPPVAANEGTIIAPPSTPAATPAAPAREAAPREPRPHAPRRPHAARPNIPVHREQ